MKTTPIAVFSAPLSWGCFFNILRLFSFAGMVLFTCCFFSPRACPQSVSKPSSSALVNVQELATPSNARRDFEKGTTLLFKRDFEASAAHLQQAIKLAPEFFPAYNNLGLAQYGLGHFDDAAQSFQKVIELSRGSVAPPFFALSLISYRRGQFADAQLLAQQGLLADPRSPIGLYCLALTQYSLGGLDNALHNALRAVQINPRLADAHLLLAQVHERLNDPQAVVADVESYLKTTPDNTFRSDALVLLERAKQSVAPNSSEPNRPNPVEPRLSAAAM
jgi:tetratricopeptide (TPR) repeat protein